MAARLTTTARTYAQVCATANDTADGQSNDWCKDKWCIVDPKNCAYKARAVSYTAAADDYFSYKTGLVARRVTTRRTASALLTRTRSLVTHRAHVSRRRCIKLLRRASLRM
eukprot:TRINITY_DN125_c0_g1_i27.p1 TRINITY_DN125_c0_g1~~TRINITY_DN125_c0_g1_i27.p1  ORF type:complete len:111 (-),score=5.79 TRINITY_DN125_c0_g1_i27:167-499(-)